MEEYQKEADEVFALIASLTDEGGTDEITKEELIMAHHGDAAVYEALDSNHDGIITRVSPSPARFFNPNYCSPYHHRRSGTTF